MLLLLLEKLYTLQYFQLVILCI